MYDIVEVIGHGSIIQHGKLNDRIYLMKLDEQDVDGIIDSLHTLASKNHYSKVFCKVPKHIAPLFLADGYVVEAYIPNFYKGSDDVFFVSKFLNPERLINLEKKQLRDLSKLLASLPRKKKAHTSDYTTRRLLHSDIEQITAIYREVFKSYPFPIHDPEYIKETMNDQVIYFGAEQGGKLVALASSEMDLKGQNAEMTDFATLPNHAGNNLASLLLDAMEIEMKNRGIKTLYTIARLNSIPMNITFLRSNYQYSGTLIKNTNIAGEIESMNVLFKQN